MNQDSDGKNEVSRRFDEAAALRPRAASGTGGVTEHERVLRRLQGIDRASAVVSAALVTLSGPDIAEFLQVIADEAREIIQAEYAALGLGGGEGRKFDQWVFSGLTGAQAAAIGRTPRGVGLLGAVMSEDRAIRLNDLREHGSFSGFPDHHPPMTSLLAVPIRFQDQSRGNLFLANKHGDGSFTEEDQILAEMLGDRVGVALEIARLHQMEAREHTRLQFLARAGSILAGSLEYEKTLAAVARLFVPATADLCTIALLQENGAAKKVTVYHSDPEKQRLLDRLKGTTPAAEFPAAMRAAIETAEPQRMDSSPEFLRGGVPELEYREIERQIGATCAIFAPLVLRGRVIGVLRLSMAESGRRYSQEDLLLAQDIARHAALAIDSAKQYRSAQRAIRARDNLLEVVSHDLRNYLSTIRIGAELLSHTGPAAEVRNARKHVDAIRRSAARMERLIESLRDATMIETGQFAIERRSERIEALVDEAIETLSPQADVRTLRLEARVGGCMPAVSCDRGRILQVIVNLIGNAIKFTEPGGEICISVDAMGNHAVCVAVSDTGAGIADNQLGRVFHRHWRGQNSSREGTGLGLFISKGIIEAHGGKIWVESRVGSGSTFFFTLPVSTETEDPAPPPDLGKNTAGDFLST